MKENWKHHRTNILEFWLRVCKDTMEKMNKVLVHLYLKIIVMFAFLSFQGVFVLLFTQVFRAVHGIMAELQSTCDARRNCCSNSSA
jgi:hypothetical protein